MKASLKKVLLAKYITYLETFGFIIMGIILLGMAFCIFFKMDDVASGQTMNVTGYMAPIAVEEPVFLVSTAAQDRQTVEPGQTIAMALKEKSDIEKIRLQESLQQAKEAFNVAYPVGTEPIALAAAIESAVTLSDAVQPSEPQPIVAPIDGVLMAADLEEKIGTITEGTIASVQNFDTLRFNLPVSGRNSERVRLSFFMPRDIKYWAGLIRLIKADDPPEDPAQRRIWDLAHDAEEPYPDMLRFVLAKRKPEPPIQDSVVRFLTSLVQRKDLYVESAWRNSGLPDEARRLIAQGVEELESNDLHRLNRLLLENALSDYIKEATYEKLRVKAEVFVPNPPIMRRGESVEQKPDKFMMYGRITSDKDPFGAVKIQLEATPAEVREYLERRVQDSSLDPVVVKGQVVVGRIRIFQFLFAK